ncbi:MAG: 50S ribosomal protein L30 [Chloroflexi bacterium RBG_19FT_COMBO_55_16]|nr:MAG: 50S ribosomal protein L30 [Chloroflexi bacterium RBG_19FT_COMBO_55_16]
MPKAKKEEKPVKVVRVTLIKSPIGYNLRQKRTVQALGLRRLHQTVEHVDAPTLRGMIAKVSHLVRVEE